VLVGLYEEQDKPSSALEYVHLFPLGRVHFAGRWRVAEGWYPRDVCHSFVRQKLGATLEDAATVESIKKENAELKKENANLKKQIAELTKAQQPQ
jgi:hypothetical protein